MDHKQSAILKTHMKMENFLVSELTITDERLWASLSNTPAVFATAGCADGSISKSIVIQTRKKHKHFKLQKKTKRRKRTLYKIAHTINLVTKWTCTFNFML